MSYPCGPIEYQDVESYRRYFCSRCFVHLNVPRVVDRNSWLNWIAGDARQIAERPLLISAHERIARTLAESRSRYTPVTIDIGTMVCPDCSESMVLGGIDSNRVHCPRCASPSASSLGISRFVSLFGEENEVDEEGVRRVIDRLKLLSQPRKRSREKAPRQTCLSETVDPLWDRELDG
jgi:hypothetical protein